MFSVAQGSTVPSDLLGELRDSSSFCRAELPRILSTQGYVFLRDVIAVDLVQRARSEVFQALADVGEIETPVEEGIATGASRRRELVSDLGTFWREVSNGPHLRQAIHGSAMRELMSVLLETEAVPHDYVFLRPGRPGLSTRLHYDHPFFARGSDRIYTAWVALGEISRELGPLMVVEEGNQFEDLLEPTRAIDYDRADTPTVQIMEDPVEFARQRNTRLLTADFRPGDVIVFDMFTLHGTLDNCSPQGEVRLSCDARWQPACDPVDPRYVGEDPPGTTGAGYGELNGAKPLTDDWHTR